MPRLVTKHQWKRDLVKDMNRLSQLTDWLAVEVTDAFSARSNLEANWREELRLYEAVPKRETVNFPIPNAPNVEIPVGAIACDSVAAQALDLIFSTSPLITCQPVPKAKNDTETIEKAKALQRYVNWMARNEVNLRVSTEEMILDDTQLGTGIYYIPYVQRRRNTSVASILSQGPMTYAMPPEDVIVPSGSLEDIDGLDWIGLRFWNNEDQLNEFALVNSLSTEGVVPAGVKDWVRQRREMLGKQMQGFERKGRIYDLFDIYCYFDIDGDGIGEDLLVTYNHTGRKVLGVTWNPFDKRPIEKAVYQRRPHLFYGLGVLGMLRSIQQELSDVHNYWTLNALLANCRIWGTSMEAPENITMYPNRQIPLRDPSKDIQGIAMADVHPSLWQLQIMLMQLAEKRVGVNELSRGGSSMQGNRTPGITALTMMQQTNKRFMPAFDGIRQCVGRTLGQCLYRFKERMLSGNASVEKHFIDVLGQHDGAIVVDLLKNESFDEHVSVELTASNAFVNQEADRQNAMLLTNILAQYYTRTVQLVMLASNPQTPQVVKDVAMKVAKSAGEIIERTIRTFDQVRDPATFIIDVEDELNKTSVDQGGLQQLLGALTPGAAAPPAGAPQAGAGMVMNMPGMEGSPLEGM